MGSVATSRHELLHVLGVAVGAQMLAPKRYAEVMVDVSITGSTGHVIATLGYVERHPADFELSKQIAGLSALGPAAPLPDVVAMVRAHDHESIARAVKLSQADVDLLGHIEGGAAPVKLALAVLAVKHLHDALGVTGMQRMAKALRDACDQGVREWALPALVPESAAKAALGAAAVNLDALMNAESQDRTSKREVQRIVNRAKAQKAVAAAKEGS